MALFKAGGVNARLNADAGEFGVHRRDLRLHADDRHVIGYHPGEDRRGSKDLENAEERKNERGCRDDEGQNLIFGLYPDPSDRQSIAKEDVPITECTREIRYPRSSNT